MRLALMAVALLLTAPLFSNQNAAADDAPGGEWVLTGPPALPPGGALLALPDGTALLIGKLVQRYHPDTGGWTPAGSLLGNGGVVTPLSSGKVLVTGVSPAEVYDPLTEVSQLVAPMHIPRGGHQATLLASGGGLVSGGTDANGKFVGPAEIYDPARDTWSLAAVLNNFRTGHAAALLRTGKVLVAGGDGPSPGGGLASAEIYDPSMGTWTFTPGMDTPRLTIGAVTLPDGRVLVAGGDGGLGVAVSSQVSFLMAACF